MIIGSTPEIYPLARFAERLTAAGRGVVRVLIGRPQTADPRTVQSTASGWLVTPTLVVVCDFAVVDQPADQPAFRCDTGAGDAVEARLAYLAGTRDGRHPALLRLDRPLSDAEPLTLDLGTAVPGRSMLVVQYPYGQAEVQLSFGRVRQLDDGFVHYDADTMPGSGGGPVLAAPELGVLAMHVGRGQDTNYALPLSAVLDGLRGAPDWPEIAQRHGLADVAAARKPVTAPTTPPTVPPDALVAAALRWSFDPAQLSDAEREALGPLVVNAMAPSWSLTLDHRQRLLREAGSLDALRAVRRRQPGTEPGREVIDRILQGAPFDLDALPLDTLPHWLQAVRWFDGTVPDLPSPAQVHRTLQRRRVREGLATVAGPGFRGRTAELALLNAWFTEPEPGPMVISGIGGIGKSALVARFAELLPATIPLYWLDFDRVDLAPDDAVSLLTELGAQAAVQLDGFTPPPVDTGSVAASATAFAAALIAAAPGPALLVLDGFEVAQHAVRHQEIWPVLEGLLGSAPALRLLVSGRAPVTNLQLGGQDAVSLRLTGLDPQVADAWLAERAVADAAVRQRVVEVCRGIPLVLKMAMRLLAAGGSVEDLPAEMVEGYLYGRILDRVVDAQLQPIARDTLQLRAVHADMLAAVLHDRIPPDVDPPTLLDRLSRELALVESLDEADGPGPGTLRMRPEVRSAVLRLLTVADPNRVAEIDRRAAAWLDAQADDDPADAAELVYHLLRLGDVAGAAAAWREGCAARLGTAAEDMFHPAAKQWLLDKLTTASAAAQLTGWEQDAAERIQVANKRGLGRTVARTLDEHHGRTADSPLLVHDAWVRWQAGDPAGAAGLLDEAGPGSGSIGRDRALVRAGLAAALGDRATADRLLAGIANEARWPDPLSALAVQAARVRLTVDLDAELELAELPDGLWTGEVPDGGLVAAICRRVVPGDVLLPRLAGHVAGLTTFQRLRVPPWPDELPGFASAVHGMRQRLRDRWPANPPTGGPPGQVERVLELAGRLGELGEHRWQLATTTPVLIGLRDRALALSRPPDPLTLAVVASLAAFRGLPLGVGPTNVVDVDTLLGGAVIGLVQPRLSDPNLPPLAQSVMASEERTDPRAGGRKVVESESALSLFANQAPTLLWQQILDKAAPMGLTPALAQAAHDQLPATAPLRAFLVELLADHPVATSGEQRATDGTPVFVTGDDAVMAPETLLYRDDLTIEIGRVPALIATLERLVTLSPAVCKVTTEFNDGQAQYGTAFRIGTDLLLSNWHVLHRRADKSPATSVTAEFRLEDDGRGGGLATVPIPCDASGVVSDEADDWAAMRTAAPLQDDWPVLPLTGVPDPARGEAAFVIQHPLGGRKRVAIVRNQVSFVDDRVVHYLSDTQVGSSGSPVFNGAGQLIALHHAGGRPQDVTGKDPVLKNEGIRIPRITAGLAAHGIELTEQ